MRPAPSPEVYMKATTGATFPPETSPVPYLFGGLGLVLALIAVALLILACSYKDSSSSTQSPNVNAAGETKPTAEKEHVLPLEMEPKFVVIMAGDHNPTYIAKPVPRTPSPVVEEV